MFRTAKTLILCLITSAASATVTYSVSEKFTQLVSQESVTSEKYSSAQREMIDRALRCQTRLKVMSFNMLTDSFDAYQRPENRWDNRKGRVAAVINTHAPDIILSQELSWHQISQLQELLESEYEFYGREGNRGFVEGIFYLPSRFEIIDKRVWDLDARKRTLTMCCLRDRQSHQSFFVFSTHLASGYGAEARHQAARDIAALVEPLVTASPVIVGGDFNTIPARPDEEQLPANDGPWVMQLMQSGSLRDAQAVSLLGSIGNLSSWTSSATDPSPFSGLGHPGLVLDHIFVGGGAHVLLHAIDPILVDGCFPSDHMPVICEVALVTRPHD